MFDGSDGLAGVDDDELSALLLESCAEVNRAEARRLEVAAEWDRRKTWAHSGSHNGRCWMAHDCVLSRAESAAILKTARVVASAPLVAAAVEQGALPVAKAEVLASVVSSRLAEAFVRDQQVLLDAVRLLSVDETRKLVRFWQMRADVDGAEPEQPARRLRFGVQDDGTTHFAGILGPD